MDIVLKYFPHITTIQKEQFEKLQSLYEDINDRVNVISRKDIDNLYINHVLHSLAIARLIEFKSGTKILDVGTGGGFPGIPLAILFPDVDFHLIDSIGKKISVVREVVNSLGLMNVRAEQIRADDIKEKYDFIISRAVTAFPRFYQWVRNKIKKGAGNTLNNGILYLKGGDLTEELSSFKNSVVEYSISKYFAEDFFESKKIIYLDVRKFNR